MSGFLGMRGNDDWVTNQRPKNWREGILFLFPNGDAPLTALTALAPSESVDDPEFNWWEKGLATQAGTVASIYLEASLTTEYTTGGTAGETVYAKVTLAVANQFREGHQIMLRTSTVFADDTVCKVTGVLKNGASSYIACQLLEDDPTTTGLASTNRILIIGNINAEGAAMPDSIAYDPTRFYNYTQIFRTPLEITRTARKTKLRTGDAYKEAKREALQLHSIEMEKAFLWGIRTQNTGSNSKPERTTLGLINWIQDNSGVVSDFTTESDFNNDNWLDEGEQWLDIQLEQIFRYGSDERMAFVGSTVLLAINQLVKEYGHFEFGPTTTSYGIKIKEWITPFGSIFMKRHPLFSYETTNRRQMVIFDPADIRYRYVDDTTFYDDPAKKNTGWTRQDGTKEEFLTEAGLEFRHSLKTGYLNGFGSDNPGGN